MIRRYFAFKRAGGWFSIFNDLSDAAPTTPSSPTHSALCALRQYYRWTRILPAAAALDRILEDTGYLALAATTPGGVDAGDVLHAVDRVRLVVEQGGSLADAADVLEGDSEAANEVESLPLEPGRTDVVSPSSVWRVLQQGGLLSRWKGKPSRKGTGFEQPPHPHQHWHIDVSYINVSGTFYYLCSILDGFSRSIVHWDLRESMSPSSFRSSMTTRK